MNESHLKVDITSKLYAERYKKKSFYFCISYKWPNDVIGLRTHGHGISNRLVCQFFSFFKQKEKEKLVIISWKR